MIRLLNVKPLLFLFIGMMGWPVAVGFAQDYLSDFDLLPRGFELREGYAPGAGPSIGTIRKVAGRVVVIHMNQAFGYAAVEGMPLYKNDTVVTLVDAQAGLLFNDGSNVLLTSRTRLQINQSVYSPRQTRRSTLLDMATGMARFVARKLADVRYSDYKVKTHTTVVGVRGSDFIISVDPDATEVSTLADTTLEVRSLAMPDEPPLVLQAYRQTVVKRDELASEARRLEAQEVERLLREFMFQPLATPDNMDDISFLIDQETDDSLKAPPAVDTGRLMIPPDMTIGRSVTDYSPDTDRELVGEMDDTSRNISEQRLDNTIIQHSPDPQEGDPGGEIDDTNWEIIEQWLDDAIKQTTRLADFPARPQ